MFSKTRIRAAAAIVAATAVIAGGPALTQAIGLGDSAPAPMPVAWEQAKQADADAMTASHLSEVAVEKDRAEARRKAKEAAERKAAAEKAARARAAQGGTPAQNRALGMRMCADRGWSASQCEDLGRLWQRESGWSTRAANPSGAYGIPQALPGGKMGSHGSDWRTNPRTQIAWGLDYIEGRYGNPSNAWGHSQRTGWY